jgi:membrane protein implicated in regulation of membrane protease activity
MADSTLWWLMAGAAVAIEMLTGTFYLLMLSLGMAAAAIAAHLGAPMTAQLIIAALAGGGAVTGWRLRKGSQKQEPPAQANPNVLLDIGEIVHVGHWKHDGTADVQYRGAHWTAITHQEHDRAPGNYQVTEIIGNRLVLSKA